MTVNGSAKSYLKRQFTEWFSSKISDELDSGKELEHIEITLHLSVLKPLHAQWLVDLYNYLTLQKGQEIIENGWKSAGITEAISVGTRGLPSLDPFASVDPLDEMVVDFTLTTATDTDVESFVTPRECFQSDSENEWVPDDDGEHFYEEEQRNIFEVLYDEDDV